MTTQTLTRQEMIERLEWAEGGYGLGGNVALSMMWAMAEPGPDKPDLKSIVAVYGPADKYTDEELAALLEFSERKTADYDRLFSQRLGANLVLFDKPEWREDGMWLRKRLTWERGPMYSATLAEAIATMERF